MLVLLNMAHGVLALAEQSAALVQLREHLVLALRQVLLVEQLQGELLATLSAQVLNFKISLETMQEIDYCTQRMAN